MEANDLLDDSAPLYMYEITSDGEANENADITNGPAGENADITNGPVDENSDITNGPADENTDPAMQDEEEMKAEVALAIIVHTPGKENMVN